MSYYKTYYCDIAFSIIPKP